MVREHRLSQGRVPEAMKQISKQAASMADLMLEALKERL